MMGHQHRFSHEHAPEVIDILQGHHVRSTMPQMPLRVRYVLYLFEAGLHDHGFSERLAAEVEAIDAEPAEFLRAR